MKAPHTVFSTELRGGKRLLKTRLGDLFAPGIRRGGGSLLLLVLCLILCLGALVSCQQEAAQPDPDTLADTALDQILDYRDERESWQMLWEAPAGEDTVYAFSYDGGPHSAGLGNLLLLAADGSTGALSGTPVSFSPATSAMPSPGPLTMVSTCCAPPLPPIRAWIPAAAAK